MVVQGHKKKRVEHVSESSDGDKLFPVISTWSCYYCAIFASINFIKYTSTHAPFYINCNIYMYFKSNPIYEIILLSAQQ